MTEKKKAKKKEHYVNNKDFLVAITAFKEEVESAKIEGLERPRVSNYIGDCIMKIAVHLSHKPNFSNYTFKEEMICDGIENCLTYIDNFNPEKSQNPFAYFTQIIYYAFLRRIAKEKKQSHVRNKMIERDAYDSFITMEGDDTYYSVEGIDTKLFLPEDDVYKPKKKESAKKKGLEVFMEDGDGKSVS